MSDLLENILKEKETKEDWWEAKVAECWITCKVCLPMQSEPAWWPQKKPHGDQKNQNDCLWERCKWPWLLAFSLPRSDAVCLLLRDVPHTGNRQWCHHVATPTLSITHLFTFWRKIDAPNKAQVTCSTMYVAGPLGGRDRTLVGSTTSTYTQTWEHR